MQTARVDGSRLRPAFIQDLVRASNNPLELYLRPLNHSYGAEIPDYRRQVIDWWSQLFSAFAPGDLPNRQLEEIWLSLDARYIANQI